MPVDFLTDEQANKYGQFSGEPTPEQLARFFHLDDNDRSHVLKRRGDHNRLGFAIQLCTVRFLGTFLVQPIEVPENIVAFLAKELNIRDTSSLHRYMDRRTTRHEHANNIKELYGYKDFNHQPGHFQLVRWLYVRSWLTAERPSVLFDLATARLANGKILLPGASSLSKLVAQVRERTAKRLWRVLSYAVNEKQITQLESLLVADEQSPEQLGPTSPSTSSRKWTVTCFCT
jgi:TnpA family transposase